MSLPEQEPNVERINEATPELTRERLHDLNTLEIELWADLEPILEKINEQLGTRLEARGNGYHITVIGPTERKILDSLSDEQLDELQHLNEAIRGGIGVEVTGIGFIDGGAREDARPADKEKKTCFVTFSIPALQEFRASIGLPPKDLHATLGFEVGDIHTHVTGHDEKGKPIVQQIEKQADPQLQAIAENMPFIEFGGIGGQEKQKKST